MDGDTRGGAALSIKTVVNKPIKFIGTGEKMDALEVFYPERMADRILGMGDIVSLVERAQEHFNEEDAEALARKMRKGEYSFNDMFTQLNQIKKMGNIKDLASMIPGMGKQLKNADLSEEKFKPVIAMIQSMTPKERECIVKLDTRRKQRIAKGSGCTPAQLNEMLKQFEFARQQYKSMASPDNMKRMEKMMTRK
jgi:signal recognition particle subunit SRP54